jgi:hypothetical protein
MFKAKGRMGKEIKTGIRENLGGGKKVDQRSDSARLSGRLTNVVDGPRQAQAVERAGAPADFVQYDQAAGGGVVEDVGRLGHLDHEGGLPASQVVGDNIPFPFTGGPGCVM